MRTRADASHHRCMTTSTSNLQTVQDIYEAFGRGDVELILDRLSDDELDFGSEVDSKVAPWHGRRRTKDEVRSFFAAIGESVDVTEFTPLAFATNETDVMVVIRWGMRVKSTGRTAEMDLHHWWRLRDGKVVFYRGTEDTALTAEAFRD